jgi:superfamily I DNA/RNA helicase/Zn-dependent peptidase ImmA (M78 family)
MEAFEPVRAKAAELHSRALIAGAVETEPLSIVAAAAKLLDLELAYVPAGDPALKGARALFDEQSGLICCEAEPLPGERAALIAHEIGHAELHGGSSTCSVTDIDASRSTESAPVGLQRVEDYGVRERRELQANVFARELLFPRAVARRLFVDDGQGASDIASKTGLSKNIVRQQLYDALLLPPIPVSEETGDCPPLTLKPDPSQETAAAHRGTAFQLQAGPGTGKTRTLVSRVRSLVEEGVHPSSILVLTFSNRAAGELGERIAALLPEAAPSIWIGTFHAFGLDLARRYHEQLELKPEPILFDRSDAIAVLHEVLPTLPLIHYRNLWDPVMMLKEILTAISRAKDEMTDPARYRALAEKMLASATCPEEKEAAEKCLEVAQVYALYEQALREHMAVDFGDLIMRTTLLLESDGAIREAVQLRHRHVLVDEYQDVNRASTRMLKAIAGDGQRLWVVGDARQSIYRFRGASSANMAAFGEEYPNARAEPLTVNYRSTTEIVELVVSLAPSMGASQGMLPLALSSANGPGHVQPEIRCFETVDDEIEGIAASVRELEASGVRLRDQAVLCRTNTRLNEIAAGLEARGIPVLHLGSLFERDEVRDLLALLSLTVDPFGDGLVRIGAMPRYGLGLQDIYVAMQWIRESGQRAIDALGQLSELPGITAEGRSGFAKLARDLEAAKRHSTPWEFLSTYLLDHTEVIRELARSESISDWMRAVAIWQFLNFARDQPPGAGFPIQRLLDRVRDLVLLAEERDLRQVPAAALHMDAVRLLTVHGSKGLEFEAAHVPSLTVSSFPSSYRGQRCPPPSGMIDRTSLSVSDEAKQSHRDEEECLFFVAVSRAQTHCRLYLSSRTPSGQNRSPSPFLGWIRNGFANEVARPEKIPLPANAPRPQPILITRSSDLHVTDGHLKSYAKCPRRYFYTHVLKLGGARKTTAFSQTHDCIYELIAWLAQSRRTGTSTIESTEAAFDEIWQERGPIDHGFAADYRALASRLIAALISTGAGRRFRDSELLAIDLPSGRVVVEPNEMTELPNGAVVLRRVQTGRKRSDEYDRLDYALYHLAGEARFGTRYEVEAIHLTDETVERVTITPKKLANRRNTSEALLTNLGRGWFPVEIDAVSCPRCPHFFNCAAVPAGPLAVD